MSTPIQLGLGSALCLSALAAVSDWRTGIIPNWLTLPPIIVAPVAYWASDGVAGAIQAITAAVLSGAVPYLLFRGNAMGGGDVKLFAALGALTGFDVRIGIEIQIYAFVFAMLLVLAQLARKGKLHSTLRSAIGIVLRSMRSQNTEHPPAESMTQHRLGVAISLSTLLECLPPIAHVWGPA